MNEIIKRIRELIADMGVTTNAFARKVGVDSSNFSKKLNGTSSLRVTKNDVEKICSKLGVSPEWLLNGTGDKYITQQEETQPEVYNMPSVTTQKNAGIPFYDVDFTLGFNEVYNDSPEVPIQYIDFPGFGKADFWCRTTGDSMSPVINGGDIVAMKEINDWHSFLLMNEVYGIVTSNDLRMIKVLRHGSSPSKFLLHSYNSEYQDQEIDKSMILHIYKVIGSVSLRTI